MCRRAFAQANLPRKVQVARLLRWVNQLEDFKLDDFDGESEAGGAGVASPAGLAELRRTCQALNASLHRDLELVSKGNRSSWAIYRGLLD